MGIFYGKSSKKEDDDNELSDDDANQFYNNEGRESHHTSSHSHTSPKEYDARSTNSRSFSMHEKRTSYTETDSGEASKLNANLKFYKNKKETMPRPGHYIKDILKWHGDYEKLEECDFYIQWLFPTRTESAYNLNCQPLQDHEAAAIRNTEKLVGRAYQAFCMMLDYYGMKHEEVKGSFQIVRASNWKERFRSLNRCVRGDLLKITRIISSMGEMGFRREQFIWLRFLLVEIVQNRTLNNLDRENIQYWIDALASEEDRSKMSEFYKHLKSVNQPQHQQILSGQSIRVTTLFEGEENQRPVTQPSRLLEIENADELECEDAMEAEFFFNFTIGNLKHFSPTACIFMKPNCQQKEHTIQTMPNLCFYLNQIRSQPDPGFFLEELKREQVNFNLMRKMHGHIQWLFPTPDRSKINTESVPLTEEEATLFVKSKELRDEFVQVYRMMLGCYGLDINLNDTGEIKKMCGWEDKFQRINSLPAFPRIITRILTSLGVMGFSHYQVPLVYFLLNETMAIRSLQNLDGSNFGYWIGVIVNNDERQMLADAYNSFKQDQWEPLHSAKGLAEIDEDAKRRDAGTRGGYAVSTENSLEVDRLDDVREIGKGDKSVKVMPIAGTRDVDKGVANLTNITDELAECELSELHVGSTRGKGSMPKYSTKDVRPRDIRKSLEDKTMVVKTRNVAEGSKSPTGNQFSSVAGKVHGYTDPTKDDKSKGVKGMVFDALKGAKEKIGDITDKWLRYPEHSKFEDLKQDWSKKDANIQFYNNEKRSSYYWGHKIEDMLGWKGDYHKLEINHQYIQWLFPIPEGRGVNYSAQALMPHEAEEMSQSPIIRRRVLRAFQMMLDFYGMELTSEDSTQVQRAEHWPKRYQHLNSSGHNHLRITRIIKSIGHLGLQKYQAPWVSFILHEIFEEKVLPRLGGRQVSYWIGAISDESERNDIYMKYLSLANGIR